MRGFFFIGSLLISLFANAQDDLFNMLLGDEDPVYVSYLFKGTKVNFKRCTDLFHGYRALSHHL